MKNAWERSLERTLIRLLYCGLVVTLVCGCSLASVRAKFAAATSDAKDAIGIASEHLNELDQATYSFADRFVTTLADACDRAAKDNSSKEAVKQALRLKLHNASAVYAIATGPNPLGQLLDLATVVTLNKLVYVDERQAVRRFGDRHAIIEQAFSTIHDDIWRVAGRFLQPQEIRSVQRLIQEWRHQHPEGTLMAYVRFDDFSRARAGLSQEAPEIGGLFDRIDKVNQTMQTAQQFGERALFYTQRLPRLLQWQTERTVEAVLDNADLQRLQAAVQQVSNAATTFATELQQFDRKQAALQDNLVKVSGIIEQIDKLAPNVQSVLQEGQKLLAVTQDTSLALGTTLQTADKLSANFASPDTPASPPAKAFDINEYTRTVSEVSGSLQRAQGLLQELQSPGLSQRLNELRSLADERIDHLVWRLAQIAILLFVLAVLYRRLTVRT